ncbi:helix-turn-helix domain-containing protein [Nocardia flavorosea]|uniref:helix-turn-helix domain-containing protein n=1 Tax=Nocardia flavorosea TaxID=53429 RepID=UPI00226BDA1E|nr:helix-turn-helix transcriptional regulator [Nocardia flavorosea]
MLPRRALGRQLRKMRLREGMTQSGAARVAEISPQSYGRLEDGRPTKVTDLAMNALCNAFSSTDEERLIVLDLAQATRNPAGFEGGWWLSHRATVTKNFSDFVTLEESATRVFSWETCLVPGLLQTREYRRALLWAEFPEMPSGQVESILDAVARRQELLSKADFHFEGLIAESVLTTVIGGPAVLADQLSHLLEVSRWPGVTMRVVGSRANDQVGMVTGPFVLFDLPPMPTSRLRQAPVVYMEGHFGRIYLDDVSEVAEYARVRERLRRTAYSEKESGELVLAALKEWNDEGSINCPVVQKQ